MPRKTHHFETALRVITLHEPGRRFPASESGQEFGNYICHFPSYECSFPSQTARKLASRTILLSCRRFLNLRRRLLRADKKAVILLLLHPWGIQQACKRTTPPRLSSIFPNSYIPHVKIKQKPIKILEVQTLVFNDCDESKMRRTLLSERECSLLTLSAHIMN